MAHGINASYGRLTAGPKMVLLVRTSCVWCAVAASAMDAVPTWKGQNALDAVEEEDLVLGGDADRGRSVNRLGNSVRFGSTRGMPNGSRHEGANGYH